MLPVTTDGRIDLSALPRLLTPKTKLVSLAHVSNVTGGCSTCVPSSRPPRRWAQR